MKKFLLTVLIAVGSAAAQAEGLYVGMAAGGSYSNLDCERAANCSRNGTGLKLFGGYKLTDHVAVEAHYANYGKAKGKFSSDLDATEINLETKVSGLGLGLALMGDLSRDWNGVVRAGLASNKVTALAWNPSMSASASETRTRPYFGAGVGYRLSQDVTLTAAVDYTQGEFIHEKVTATLYTIGVTYDF